jgi:hypothetical protein
MTYNLRPLTVSRIFKLQQLSTSRPTCVLVMVWISECTQGPQMLKPCVVLVDGTAQFISAVL